MKLNNRCVLVTGAASGLGLATATTMAEQGAIVFGIDLPSAISTVSPVSGVTFVEADVTSEPQIEAVLNRIAEQAAPLSVVVNCAGIAPAQRILGKGGVHDLATFEKTLAVNLVGTFNVLRLAAAVMAKNDADIDGQRGVIINTASVAAYEGQIGQAAYAASKGGVVSLTITAARDLARNGIRVNTIAPGIVRTPLLEALGAEVNASLAAAVPFPQRLATPEEFASLVTMVVSHDYLNGETIRMDGALRMPPQ